MSIGWAIISASDYADSRGAPAINQAQGAELVAVSSRDRGRSDAFAQKHGAKTAYTSVEDVLSDSRVDAVYITSPNWMSPPPCDPDFRTEDMFMAGAMLGRAFDISGESRYLDLLVKFLIGGNIQQGDGLFWHIARTASLPG